jgi:hypothetical protein
VLSGNNRFHRAAVPEILCWLGAWVFAIPAIRAAVQGQDGHSAGVTAPTSPFNP